MKIYQKINVYDAAIERIRYLFDEFENICVCISGGKDSTVIMNLALKVAEERNRLPLDIMFLDQEAEWQTVIDYIREISKDPRVRMHWFQMPIRLFNASSHTENWLGCWTPGAEWMRPKEPNSIHNNKFGTDRFVPVFAEILNSMYGGQKACYLTGVRAEESPIRRIGLCTARTYKHVTYGKILNKARDQYNFHPLYDWTTSDIWHAIEKFQWPYCHIYDQMYRAGQGQREMRVSNLHHETAMLQLQFLQEIEPQTWKALVKRLGGINTQKHLAKESTKLPPKLPSAFTSWLDMRDYLTDKLIVDESQRETFIKKWIEMDRVYSDIKSKDSMHKVQIRAILLNDYHMTTVNNWERDPNVAEWRRWRHKGKPIKNASNKYIYGR